jgi:3-oxoacyl-[acyl-carrier-protein] synthase-1
MHLAIKASGMVTAVGFNARSTCAAIRAGVSGVRKEGLLDRSSGEHLRVGRPLLPQRWYGTELLAELAAPAIGECLSALPSDARREDVPLFLLVSPPSRPHREPDLDIALLGGLGHRLGFRVSPFSRIVAEGRTGILTALLAAMELVKGRRAKQVVVAGVESFLRQEVVDAYAQRRRVLRADNSNGFIPSEGACAVLLAAATPQSPELRIAGWGRGREPGAGEAPVTGDGLTQALREALAMAGVRFGDTDVWLTDQNAEHDKAKECTIAKIRLDRRMKPELPQYPIQHPIEFLGEIGSAIGPCLLGVHLAGCVRKYAPGPLALVSVGEDDGERVGLVLRWMERS